MRKPRTGRGIRNERLHCTISHLSRAGLSQSQIARRLGVSRQRIHQLTNPKYRGTALKGCKRTRHDRLQVAMRLRWQGYNNSRIGEYLEVSNGLVSAWLKGKAVPPATWTRRRKC